jgi:transposase InsO family protein
MDPATPSVAMVVVGPWAHTATWAGDEVKVPTGSGGLVHLRQEKVFIQLGAKERDPRSWIYDTEATNHMTGSRSAFANLHMAVFGSVRFGDDSVVEIEGRGTMLFKCKNGEHRSFTGVYYIPRLTANIVSLGQLEEAYYDVHLRCGGMDIREPKGRLLARIPRAGNQLYVLNIGVAWPVCLASRDEESAWRRHVRLGHINMPALRKMAREELVRGLPSIEQVDQLCELCLAGKQRRTVFPDQTQRQAEHALELVHGDLCGPATPVTPSGNTYFLLLIDDRSRCMWLTQLRSKDRATTSIKEFQARAEAESGCKLLALRTDHGGEFTSKEFMEYCMADGVHQQLTAPYSPQQNDVVERRNTMVAGTTCCLLKAKGLSAWFWGEAVNAAVYLLNQVPTKAVEGKTPFEAWYRKKPMVHHLKTYGCIVYVKNTTPHLKKMEDHGRKMIFIGYECGSKAYRAYDLATKRVHVTRDVVFDESAQWDWSEGAKTGTSADHGGDDTFTIQSGVVAGQGGV